MINNRMICRDIKNITVGAVYQRAAVNSVPFKGVTGNRRCCHLTEQGARVYRVIFRCFNGFIVSAQVFYSYRIINIF